MAGHHAIHPRASARGILAKVSKKGAQAPLLAAQESRADLTPGHDLLFYQRPVSSLNYASKKMAEI
jgi:hypothetical protein